MVSILPLNELKEKTLGMSAFFETSKPYPESYGTSSGNHDGAGLSHGVLQYNFGTGSLNTLWRFLIDTYPSVCQNAFRGDTARYNEWVSVVQDTVTANQVAWGDSISYPKDGSALDRRFVLEPWNSYFMNLGTTRESIDRQVSMSDSWRVNADNWFNSITQIWSRKAYFLLWDISVQMGRLNPLSAIQTEFADSANYVGKTELESEQWRCDRLAWHSAYNNAVSSGNQAGVFKRKDMIAKETGDWWGTPYNGVTYDAVLEPAFVGERTYSYPVITTLTDDNPRANNAMSSITGYNQTIVTVAFDQAITKYSVNRGGTSVETGTVLESGDITRAAGQTFTVTIDNTDLVTGDNTIYIYGLNESGLWSDGVTSVAPPVSTYRYIMISGYGELSGGTASNSTRMVEVEVFSGGVNRMAGKVGNSAPVDFGSDSPSSPPQTSAPTRVTDNVKTNTAYHGWWADRTLYGNAGNGWVKFDLGQSYAIEEIRYWCYYTTNRYARFKIWGTNNLADFGANGSVGAATILWDEELNSTNLTVGTTIGTNNYMRKLL